LTVHILDMAGILVMSSEVNDLPLCNSEVGRGYAGNEDGKEGLR
jgi:hypothetical protein